MVVLRPLRGGDSNAFDAQETSPSQAAFDAVQVIDASPFQFRSTKSHQASPCWPRSVCAGGHTKDRRDGDDRGWSGWRSPGNPGGRRTARGKGPWSVSYTHLRAHETDSYLVCR